MKIKAILPSYTCVPYPANEYHEAKHMIKKATMLLLEEL